MDSCRDIVGIAPVQGRGTNQREGNSQLSMQQGVRGGGKGRRNYAGGESGWREIDKSMEKPSAWKGHLHVHRVTTSGVYDAA